MKKHTQGRLAQVNLEYLVVEHDGVGLCQVLSDLITALEFEQPPNRRQEEILDLISILAEKMTHYFVEDSIPRVEDWPRDDDL